MKRFLSVGVLFLAFSLQIRNTAGANGGSDVDTLRIEFELLREDLHDVKLELRRKSNKVQILNRKMTQLQNVVDKVRSEPAASTRSPGFDWRELQAAVRINSAKISLLRVTADINHADQEARLADLHENQRLCECSKGSRGTELEGNLAGLPVRLVGGNSSDEGRVEIQYDSTWGTVCGDSWDVRDAAVLCRQLGDTNSTGIPILDERFGAGSGPIWMGNTACNGNEAGLGICPATKWNESDCDHSEDAGVWCLNVPVLRFTQAYGDDVVIEAGGATARDGEERPADWTNVRTDGLPTTYRRHYWETEFTWRPRSDPGDSQWWWVGSVGVRREGSGFRRVQGTDDQSWVVGIQYNFGQKKWRYYCNHGPEPSFESQPFTYNSSENTSHLGFMLNPADKTLIVVESISNARWCSFQVLEAKSKPLVPLVVFGYTRFERRFRLRAVDPTGLPERLSELINN